MLGIRPEMMPDSNVADLLEYTRSHYFGLYRGVVTNNDDPQQLGRLEVRVPSVTGTLARWAMPCVPYAGDEEGFYCLPAAGTGVWIQYEAGDAAFPVWVGCYWADGKLPDKGGPSIKIWKTAQVTIRIDDSSGETVIKNSNVTITAASDLSMEVGGSTQTISPSDVKVESGAGSLQVGPANVNINKGSLQVL